MKFVATADGNDGQLDMCTFRRGGFWNAVRYTAMMYLRQHRRLADVQLVHAKRFRVSASDEVPYQLDGDPIASLPLDIDVVANRLTLLVKPTNAR